MLLKCQGSLPQHWEGSVQSRVLQDAQLDIESVGHIGKDSNNNRSK